MLETVKMWKVVCDEPGCAVETGDLGGDFTAWTDPGYALDDWVAADGQMTEDGQTYCINHRKDEED